MKGNDSRAFAKYYDQIYLTMKDYQREAMIVQGVIKQFEKKQSNTLLDVGCGTGEHLKYLCSDFQCMGLDIGRDMIEIAGKKVLDATFEVASMVDFSLTEKFDVIVCLFSSIGYVQTFHNLVKTLGNFYKHLNDKGLAIVEPWVFKKDFKEGHIGLDTYEDEELKLARMGTSRIVGSKWSIFLHYLIGQKGEVEYAEEVHEMLAIDHEDYVSAFEEAGFKDTQYLTENLWEGCRGLFVATR